MTILPKGDWSIPGTWVPHLRTDNSDGAIVICPKCAQGSVVNMKINVEGNYHALLDTKFDCPYPSCGFADTIKLMWWNRKAV